MSDLLATHQIDETRIRKQWYKGEWYYSLIDVVAVLRNTDLKQAQNHYHVMKNYLKTINEFPHVEKMKALSLDDKMRLTDFTNEEGVQLIQKYIEPKIRLKKIRIEVTNRDEISLLHPKVITVFEARGFKVEHHVRLSSGSIVDIVATNGSQKYLVECKIRLNKAALYGAIGQILCYVSEYQGVVVPVIAAYRAEIDDYARQCCRKLGIEILEIDDE